MTRFRGSGLPRIPFRFPQVTFRAGVDEFPIDVSDPDEVLWLRSMVWPERRDHADLLATACEVPQGDSPEVVEGDPVAMLSNLLMLIPENSAICIYHTDLSHRYPASTMEQIEDLVTEYGAENNIHWLHDEDGRVELSAFESGVKTTRHQADCDSHGRWMEWVDEPMK